MTSPTKEAIERIRAHEALEAEVEALRGALKRMLLEFDFMIEAKIIPDIRSDIIFVEARTALGETQ